MRSLAFPISVDGEVRSLNFQMREGETPEVLAREMVAGLGLGGGAQREAAMAASIRAAHTQASAGNGSQAGSGKGWQGRGMGSTLGCGSPHAPGSAGSAGLPALYHRAAAYIVEEENDEGWDDEGGEDAAAEVPTDKEQGAGSSEGETHRDKSPLPIPRTNMLPVEEPGADEFLFYGPGEPRTPVASPQLKRMVLA